MPVRPLILILITKADVGGAQVHVLEILRRLASRYRFVLASGEEDYLTREARLLGVEVRVLKHLKRPISLRKDYRAYKECTSLLRELNPALLHVHSSKAGVVGRLAAWRLGVPILFTAHGWAFTEGAPMIRRAYGLIVESLLCRLRSRVITVSRYDFQLADRYRVGNRKYRRLIQNGVSHTRHSASSGNHDCLQLITIGRQSRVKNHSLMLDALTKLKIPFHATIVGEGELRDSIEQQIEKLGLQEQVTLLGEVTETSSILSAADIFVLSSNYEGLPLSVLEAMSLGMPVVATDVGGVSEAVLDGKTGLLSAAQDAEQLAKNITRLGTDSTLSAEYGTAGLAHFEKHFTAKRMINELEPVYLEILNSGDQ